MNMKSKDKLNFLKKNIFEIIFILIFLIFLLKFSSVLSGQRVTHDSPYQFVAGDMFWLTAESLGIMETENLNTRASFLMKGDKEVFNNYPFILPMIVAELSFFTGFEVYDILFHLNIFFMFFIIGSLYLILRKIHQGIAIAGIPLVLLIYKWPFNYVLTWGGQMSDTNMFLVFFAIIIFMYLNIRYMFIVLGIVNAAGIFSHARESLIFNIGILFFFILQLILKKFDKKLFIKYVLSAIVTVVILSNWLPTMKNIFGIYGGGQSIIKYCPAKLSSIHVVLLSEFNFLKWVIVTGFFLAVISLFFSRISMNKKFGIIMFFTFLFNSYFCVLGNKTSQIRHFFPITLAFFLGFLIWIILSKIPLNKKFREFGVISISIIILCVFLFNFFPNSISEYPVSNPFTHEAFKWIENNLKNNERILYGYGDNHNQWTLFFLAKKVHDIIDHKDFFNQVQQRKIVSRFKVRKGSLGYYFKRTSLFNLDYYGIDFFENNTICDYNYFYFNKVSQFPVINMYSEKLKDILIDELEFTEVFTNPLVSILKNPDVGGVCFEERIFVSNIKK